MAALLVIGGTSLDLLHADGRKVPSAGGAGMYTAMAARRRGVGVSLFAPRPRPIPRTLRPVAERLEQWLGPTVRPEELPRFEIAHKAGTATYLSSFFGAETELAPEALPADLSGYDVVHVVPLGDVYRQRAFVRASRERGARRVSAGTFIESVVAFPSVVREIMAETDVFFMNREEAEALFGTLDAAATRVGAVLFVTMGSAGARVVQGAHATPVPPAPARERDPTGAGDTFCGATLAGLTRGEHPVMAARAAVALAAATIQRIGPGALFFGGPLPALPAAAGVAVDEARVRRVARAVAGSDQAVPSDFTGRGLPRAGHPRALELFFAATLQQFGFWSEAAGRYERPMVAMLGGTALKGSSYLFAAYLRRLERDPDLCAPARQAAVTRAELLEVLRADDGVDPVPALDIHVAQARQYGEDMLALGLDPAGIVRAARASPRPLRTFLRQLDSVGGYKEDPLRKKSSLLALILSQRPERFLVFSDGEDVPPVIDYHLMRSCLRTGLVTVRDTVLRTALEQRALVAADKEWAVRQACYRAIQRVIDESGKGCGAVDWFFFGARLRCPEMTEPECRRCPLDPVCAHRTELFQPVIRTSFY